MPDLMEWPDDAPEPFDVLNETLDGYVTNWDGGDDATPTAGGSMIDRHYSDALDEIYRLRQILAYEALCVRATLEYRTFPKSRRDTHERQIERMQAAARGESEIVLAPLASMVLRHAAKDAGARETLTRWQWEHRTDEREAS